MRRYFIVQLLMCSVLMSSCYDSKVDRLRLEIMERQLAALENWQQSLNGNIAALQKLVDALNTDKYIASVDETADGYTLVLNDGSIVRLYHGRKGETGETGQVAVPSVSVRDSSDGHVYWMMNGQVVVGPDGHAVRVDGVKGEEGDQGNQGGQGEMGVVPLMRINPGTDMWEISVDQGETWTSTGVKATGKKGETGETGVVGPVGPEGEMGPWGDGVFAENGVDIHTDYVDFTLADGRVVRLSRYVEWKLEFSAGLIYQVAVSGQTAVQFTISGYGGSPLVDAVGNNGWLAGVRMDDVTSGTGEIVVTAPSRVCAGQVLVILSNGEGKCRTFILSVSSF